MKEVKTVIKGTILAERISKLADELTGMKEYANGNGQTLDPIVDVNSNSLGAHYLYDGYYDRTKRDLNYRCYGSAVAWLAIAIGMRHEHYKPAMLMCEDAVNDYLGVDLRQFAKQYNDVWGNNYGHEIWSSKRSWNVKDVKGFTTQFTSDHLQDQLRSFALRVNGSRDLSYTEDPARVLRQRIYKMCEYLINVANRIGGSGFDPCVLPNICGIDAGIVNMEWCINKEYLNWQVINGNDYGSIGGIPAWFAVAMEAKCTKEVAADPSDERDGIAAVNKWLDTDLRSFAMNNPEVWGNAKGADLWTSPEAWSSDVREGGRYHPRFIWEHLWRVAANLWECEGDIKV